MKKIYFGLLLSLFALLSGCSTVAPEYAGSRKNVEAVKNMGDIKIKVGKFLDSEDPENKKQLTMRANTLTSPYGPTFSSYIENAVRKDLTLAGSYSDNSELVIGGVLHKNSIDVSGFSVGTGVCEVEFNVSKGSVILFNKRINQNHQWESSFAAAIAIPKAINEYPVIVEKLLNDLFVDKNFIKAIGSANGE